MARDGIVLNLLILAVAGAPQVVAAQRAAVDLGEADVGDGMASVQRGNNTDGENDATTCGPAGALREARLNRGAADDDFPDHYFYFVVTDPELKAAPRLRVSATLFDDVDFRGNPVEVRLQYTNSRSSGPGDIANTFASHPRSWTLSGSGQWVRHEWSVTDAGFRSFMQGTSDFRLDLGPRRVCVDRVEAVLEAEISPEEHLVGAHYYPWYDPGRWNFRECVAGALRLELDPPQRPFLGRYSSDRDTVVDRHLRWCAEYGVNLLILEFFRPDTREDRICRQVIFRHRRSADVHFTVLYDWAIRFAGDFQVTPARIATARLDFDHLARTYFNQPTYFRVGGQRPLVLIYVTRALRGDIEGLIGATREVCAARGFDIFLVGDEFFFVGAPNGERIARWDGIFGYDVYASRGGYWGTNGSLDLFRRRTEEYRRVAAEVGVKFFPSCAPGFNDRAIRRTCANHPALPRQLAPGDDFTSLFRATFGGIGLGSTDREVPMVCVTSFNEWHEDTQIEPTGGSGATTDRDSSPAGNSYTGGFQFRDYGMDFLEVIRDATVAVTGRVLRAGQPVPGAEIEVLKGQNVLLTRRSFTTGVYTVPRLRLEPGGVYRLGVTVPGFEPILSSPFTVLAARTIEDFDLLLGDSFIRGDPNADGVTDISDAVFILVSLFVGGPAPICPGSADADGSGRVDISDAIHLLAHLFLGGPAPPPPHPDCGAASTGDGLPCESFPPCVPR